MKYDEFNQDTIKDFRREVVQKRAKPGEFSGTLQKYFNSVIKTIDEDARLIDFIISTESVDRMGDTISVKGWDLKQYRKNPVVLFGHDSRQPPIGKARSVQKVDGALIARAEFMDKDLSSFAFSIFQMYVKGFMKATSVGFRPLAWERAPEDDQEDRPFGLDFKKQELLEFSAVPVPANPEALIQARSAGIDTEPIKSWAAKILDEWTETKDGLFMPRDMVESIRKDADSKQAKSVTVEKTEDEDRPDETTKTDVSKETEKTESPKAKEGKSMEDGIEDDTDDSFDLEAEEKAAAEAAEKTAKESTQTKEKPNETEESATVSIPVEKLSLFADEIAKAVGAKIKTTVEEAEENESEEIDVEDDTSKDSVDLEKLLDSLLNDVDTILDAIDAGEATIGKSRKGQRLLKTASDAFESLASALREYTKSKDKAEEKEEVKETSNTETDEIDIIDDSAEENKSVDVEDENDGEDFEELMTALKEMIPDVVNEVVTKKINEVTGKVA